MPPNSIPVPLVSIALLIGLSGCGGGTGASGGTDADSAAPQSGAAAASASETSSLSGRVADGYLRGARVCVDLDENESCGDDEPSAITGEGGSWTLELTPAQEGKPIIADIPATAIDEDTGEPIGQALVFTAPATKPDFLSPITTLVQQELRANPALDVAAAEHIVKSSLGLGLGDEDVSLFEDYVARERENGGNSATAERFRYLHDTARVITSMMQDIEFQVGRAAILQGYDVASGSEAGRAIREIVREEVRDLLPEIAREVATLVDRSTTATLDSEVDGGTGGERFDPQRIAELLRPVDAAEGVDERIKAIRDREAPLPADLKTLLSAGVYWIDADCEPVHRVADVDEAHAGTSLETSGLDAPAELDALTVDGDVPDASRDRCRAFHGFTRIDASGQLQTTEFAYDSASGQWLEVVPADETLRVSFDLALLDGEWIRHAGGAPQGAVRFTEDGAAVVADTFGDTTLYGATRALGGIPLLEHLRSENGPWGELVDERTHFPEGATATRLNVLAAVPTHLLRSYPDADPSDGFDCSEFGYNCNVVHALIDGAHVAQTSLDETRARIGNGGLDILGVGGAVDNDLVTVMRLAAEVSADGSLPSAGTVHWMEKPHHQQPRYAENMAPDGTLAQPEEGTAPDGSFAPPEASTAPDGSLAQSSEFVASPEYENFPEHGVDPAGEVLPLARFESRWKLVAVDGVAMIEVELPVALRFDDDSGDDRGDSDRDDETSRALLMAEHEGFLRQGVRSSGQRVDSVTIYDEKSFDVLRAILEARLAGGVDVR